jgi:uncharacterized membrane protein YsdA (DUF1294 family)
MAKKNSDRRITYSSSTHDGSKPVETDSPYLRFLLLGAFVLGLFSVVARLGTGLNPEAALLIGINGAALFLCGFDKSVAVSGKTRIPEGVLLAFCLFGGTVGLISGMCLFRHKTRKASFIFSLLIILVVQIQILRSTGFIEAVQGRAAEEEIE